MADETRNLDGILPGETDFRHLEDKLLGGAAQEQREQWARAAANCFQLVPDDVLAAIVAGGEQLFIDRARVTYARDALRTENFRLMWEIVNRIADDRLKKATPVGGTH